jgi:hypothetical protein
MAKVNIDFEWSRAHDYECGSRHGGRLIIRPVGRARERTRPLELDSEKLIALQFQKLNGSPEQCVRFARVFGLLLTEPKSDGSGEWLEDWQNAIERVGQIIRGAEGTGTLKIASLDLMLRCGVPGSTPRLVYQPRTLLDAMLLQFAQSRVSGSAIRQCEECQDLFEAGGRERRSDAKFCSVACKDKAQYKKRARK